MRFFRNPLTLIILSSSQSRGRGKAFGVSTCAAFNLECEGRELIIVHWRGLKEI